MTLRSFDVGNLAAGVLFVLFGLFFGLQSAGLEIGTALRMGPGYFPLVLSGILLLLGLVIAASAVRTEGDANIGALAWRGMVFILPAPVFFGLTVQGLGFVPAIFLTTAIAGRASLRMRWPSTLLLATGVTLFATAVFSYGLGLPFRRIGPWLDFG